MSIVLPKVTKAKFFGYKPIFDNTIELEIKNNLFILLGGNGLGKTTILQSIVYCLGGSLDNKIENSPEKRWNRTYFLERFDNPDASYIEVEFKLRNDTLKIKRGFQSDKLLELSVNGKQISSNKLDADHEFENYLINIAKYDSLNSFRFLIHKLCFLSEKRENLVWDREIQTRILMLIFSDSIAENTFREKSDQLQKFDSKMRHLQVDINKIQDKLQLLKSRKKEKSQTNVSFKQKLEKRENEISDLKSTYIETISSKFELQKKIRLLVGELSNLNSEIEDIQDKITHNEQLFLYKQITNYESEESKLAIHKLIHHKLCPACGTVNEELHKNAVRFLNEASCPLCGSYSDSDIKKMAPGLEAELTEKLKSKIALESNLIASENSLRDLQDKENALQFSLNKYILDTPTVIFVKDYNKKKAGREELQTTLLSYKQQKTDFQIQFDKLKGDLDKAYETFRKRNNERLERLSNLYAAYASEFLGMPCTLIPIDNNRDFLELKLFVPRFNNKTRGNPESCSEAQRFFLDIAFRMSLIEMVFILSKANATFLCETPENALDFSYRNNVADMFHLFMEKKNTIILSSNIQPRGIAGSLLFHIPKEKRASAILNFLKIGKLTNVQENQIKELNGIVNNLLTQKL